MFLPNMQSNNNKIQLQFVILLKQTVDTQPTESQQSNRLQLLTTNIVHTNIAEDDF